MGKPPADAVSAFDPAEGGATAPPAALKRLAVKIAEAEAQEQLVDQLEADLKAAKSLLHHLRTVVLPEFMARANTTDFTLGDKRVYLEDFVSGSLPKEPEARQKAMGEFLKYEGAEGLVTTELTIPFSKTQHNEAGDLMGRLVVEGYPATLDTSIHHQTLMAFVRNRLTSGKPIDLDALGLFSGKVAKIGPAAKVKMTTRKGAKGK